MMSSISDSSDSSLESDCLSSNLEFKLEDEESGTRETTTVSPLPIVNDVDEGAYQDKPIASNEWLEDYKQEEKEKRENEEKLTKWLNGLLPVTFC